MTTSLQQIAQNVAQKEVIINQNFDSVSSAALFSRRNSLATGLTFQFYGGNYPDSNGTMLFLENGSINLTPSAVNYIEFSQETGLVTSNTSSYTEGSIAIGRATCSAFSITSYIQDKTLALIATGSSGSGGGGGGGGGDTFVSIFDYRKDADMAFTIKGGMWFTNGKAVYDTIKTVAEYTNIYEINLDPDSTYRVVYDYVYNTINTLLLNSIDIGPSTKTSKLLYIIKTDSTKISEVHDYRKYDLLVNNSVFVSALDLTSVNKTYRFSFDFLSDLLQTGSNSTVLNAWRNVYPQLSRPTFGLLCIIDDAGYSSFDEAEFHTSVTDKTKPWRFDKASNSYDIFVDDDIYVFNPTTMQWQVIDYNKWQLIIKLELELH